MTYQEKSEFTQLVEADVLRESLGGTGDLIAEVMEFLFIFSAFIGMVVAGLGGLLLVFLNLFYLIFN